MVLASARGMLACFSCTIAIGCAVDTEPLGAKGSCASGFVVGIEGDGTLRCSDAADRLATRGVQGNVEVSGKVGVAAPTDSSAASVNVGGAVAVGVGVGTGGLTGGTANNLLVHGRSDTAVTAAAIQFGDNSDGGSRQFAIVNGRSDSSSMPGSLFVLASDAVNKDPLSTGHGVPVMSMTSEGHVGIGTRAPAAELDVRGRTRLGPDLLLANDAAPADQRIWREFVDGSTWYLAALPDTLTPEHQAIVVRRQGASIASVSFAGYVQLDLVSGQPPAADCSAAGGYGRMKVDPTNGRLWVCVAAGWRSTVLSP